MKRFLFAAVMAAIATPVCAGVSVTIGQPGFYGQINIGGVPQPPQLLYPQPVIIQPPVGLAPPPIYLRVPPGHAKHWSKHCYKYNACGQPVYFVNDNWYNQVFVPYYREYGERGDYHEHHDYRGGPYGEGGGRGGEGHGHGGGNGHGEGRGHGRGHGRD